MPTKNKYTLFAYYFLFEGTFTSAFKDKKSRREVPKSSSSLFCWRMDGSGSRSEQIMMDPDPGGPKTIGSGSTTLYTDCSFTCFLCQKRQV